MLEHLREFILDKSAWIWVALAGVLGRLIYHSGQVQMGKRKFWSKELMLELPVALGMGFIAHGVCKYFGLVPDVETAAAILAGYLGPRGIDVIVTKYIGKKVGD